MLGILFLAAAPVGVLAETSYTYTYDYWEEYQECPDAYTVCKVFTSVELGLEKKLKNPQGITVVGDTIYICDTGNNRIIELKKISREKLEVVRIIEEFQGDVEVNTFNEPMDIAVSEDNNLFICDKMNGRVLKLDMDLNYICSFVKPDDTTLAADLEFKPEKLIVDTAERVYCISEGINKGVIKYESDCTFSGFIGATPVVYNTWDYIWKKIASQEQRARMVNFVPTEYSNLYVDKEGFIYTTCDSMEEADLRDGKIDAVRKLNLLGSDILVRNGNYPVYGDLYMGTGGNCTGPSRFSDITVFDNDVYTCLDATRGRLFSYDDQGRLMFAFGGKGSMDGYFRSAAGIEHIGYDLYVLDSLDNSITVFIPTEFGLNSLMTDSMMQPASHGRR